MNVCLAHAQCCAMLKQRYTVKGVSSASCLELCNAISVTTICSARTPSPHYLILYFLPVWEGRGQQSHLTAA